LEWSDRFATGIEHIDEQHKMLFRMSHDYRATLDEGRGERVYSLLLESLEHYARGHFGFEEQCMHRYQCPVAQTNSDAHVKFVETLAGFRQRYAATGFDKAEAQRLVQFIDGWLADHIGRIDVQLKQYAAAAKH
jgi:hemerythrin